MSTAIEIPAPPRRKPRAGITHITVRGARQHNLRNVDVSIPRNTLTVVTGLSGSGKSSLAFDTIYAEGQRRYVETLSAYARQFLDQMERPDVDSIDGLSPAISIEQKTTSRSPRSTVGTITEIYDYLRLLYASVGQPHCPNCGRPISRQSADQIVAQIVDRATAFAPSTERITVFAPIVRGRKGEFREELEALDQQGFRARIDGEMTELTEGMRLEKRKNHTVEAVVDRIILKPVPPDPTQTESVNEALAGTVKYDTRRLEASVQKALQMAGGLVLIAIQNPHTRHQEETLFSSTMACPDCGINVPKLEPRSFSFNSNYGACPECHGLGSIYDFDPAKTIADWSKPLLDGAMGPGSGSQYLLKLIKLAAEKYKINLKLPFSELSKEHQDLLLYGPPAGETGRTGFHGIFAYLRANLDETRSEGYRDYMMQYMSATACPRCHGRRLRPESLAVTIPIPNTPVILSGARSAESKNPDAARPNSAVRPFSTDTAPAAGLSIADYTALSLTRALTAARAMNFLGRDRIIADRLQREIIERLEFLNAVGLGYLSLDRSAATLSGGEGQRIRLATQIGSRLRGVLYVLDEPSIGLHQRDNQRLIAALERLRDLGNTVLVVEHDEDTIRKADYVLDLGPGAGKNGGFLIADGTPAQIMANPDSITGQYLAGKIPIVTRPARVLEDGTEDLSPRPLTGAWVTVEDARSHNLQNVTAHFPLGVMTVVTGVSGSGKSSLVNDILYRALAKELYGSREEPGQHGKVIGVDQLDKVIQIDQSPIGRTPRSNPATYTGVFTAIRDLFAMLPESRERGYKPGRFSFNVQGGRCEACQGEGQRRIEMNFLPDVYILCEVCNGRRYNQETLAVRFNGYNIADLLDLSIGDAVPILKDIPAVGNKLQTLVDVGLGYIHLGQSATTLSGGEAQRMKLARELSKRQTGRTLYLLDEPTTGLHFDDVRRLLEVLHRLTDLGNTVIIIEHNLDIIRNADYLLDLGPEGGEFGGRIIGHGTPEQLATVAQSHTGHFLRPHFPNLNALGAQVSLLRPGTERNQIPIPARSPPASAPKPTPSSSRRRNSSPLKRRRDAPPPARTSPPKNPASPQRKPRASPEPASPTPPAFSASHKQVRTFGTTRMNRRLVPFVLVGAVLFVAANAWMALRAVAWLEKTEGWVDHTYQALTQVERVIGTAKDAETASRGFVLTGEDRYMASYLVARRDLPVELNTFQSLTADNISQQHRAVEMRAIMEERLALLDQTNALRSSSETLDTLHAMVLMDAGKAQMDRMRDVAGDMEREERRLLADRTRETTAAAHRVRSTIALASALDLLLIMFMFRYFLRERSLRMTAESTAESLALSRIEVERKAAEIQALNSELEERVQQRTAELESTNRELEAFSYSVSHDLRAPLRTIDGFSLALEEDYGDIVGVEGKDYIGRVRAGVQRMGGLIDALLQLSRITRAEITREQVDATALAESVAAQITEQNPEQKIVFQIEPGLHTEADPKLLRVAIENLFNNAAKFSSRKPESFIIFGFDHAANAFFVRDNGAGFDMHYKDKLFGAFNRLHGDKDFKGSGIGLATVARVIRRHHGNIWADATVGTGATFWFSLG